MEHPFLKSPLGESPVIIEAPFNASVARLFRAWTNPKQIKQWFGSDEGGPAEASVDLKVNGEWRFAFAENEGKQDILSGRYLEIETDKRLVFSWTHTLVLADGSTEQSPESRVTIDFETRGEASHLKLVHELISSDGARKNIGGGWNNSVTKLKALVDTEAQKV